MITACECTAPLRNPRYIWQLPDWPHFSYDAAALTAALAQVHRAQGQWMGRKAELGMTQREQATLQVLTQEVLKTSEIEGERLNLDTVRSSIARRLGLDIGALFPTGYSGRPRITVAGWRLDASGPRDVVSGAVDRENVHFTAPPAATLAAHTDTLLQWFEAAPAGDALIKAALAHLWLVTLHPSTTAMAASAALWATGRWHVRKK